MLELPVRKKTSTGNDPPRQASANSTANLQSASLGTCGTETVGTARIVLALSAWTAQAARHPAKIKPMQRLTKEAVAPTERRFGPIQTNSTGVRILIRDENKRHLSKIHSSLTSTFALYHAPFAPHDIRFRSGRMSALPSFELPLWVGSCPMATLESPGRYRQRSGHSLTEVLRLLSSRSRPSRVIDPPGLSGRSSLDVADRERAIRSSGRRGSVSTAES